MKKTQTIPKFKIGQTVHHVTEIYEDSHCPTCGHREGRKLVTEVESDMVEEIRIREDGIWYILVDDNFCETAEDKLFSSKKEAKESI